MSDKELAAYFAEVSGSLLSEPGDVTFERVAERAVEVVPGADAATVLLRKKGGKAATVAATSDAARAVDTAQFELGEGPCLAATFETENCLVPDVERSGQWPRWTPVALGHGVRSVLAIRLHSATETLGALNLYAREPDVFDDEVLDVALIYAVHATEALSKARLVTNLQAALESRHLIGMAQGMLAAKYDVSYETAFTVLQRYSNDTNTKLREVARLVLDARGLPGQVAPARRADPA